MALIGQLVGRDCASGWGFVLAARQVSTTLTVNAPTAATSACDAYLNRSNVKITDLWYGQSFLDTQLLLSA